MFIKHSIPTTPKTGVTVMKMTTSFFWWRLWSSQQLPTPCDKSLSPSTLSSRVLRTQAVLSTLE